MTRWGVAVGLLASLGALDPGPALGHEERLLVGTVLQVEPARRLLVVRDARGDERRRLEVNAETEVVICGLATGLAGLTPGSLVRVKYLDRAGSTPDVLSVLVLGPGRHR